MSRESYDNWTQYFYYFIDLSLQLGIGTLGTVVNVALFFMDTSPYKNLWLVEPCLFIIGGIYTSIVMLPEIRDLKNDEIVAKKGKINIMCVNWEDI